MPNLTILGVHPIISAPKLPVYAADALEFTTRMSSWLPDGQQFAVLGALGGYDAHEIVAWCKGEVIIPQHAWTIMNLVEHCQKRGAGLPIELLGCGGTELHVDPKPPAIDSGEEIA